MKKQVMVFIILCLLLGSVSGCVRNEQGKEDLDSNLVETAVSYLQNITHFYAMCQTDDGAYLIFGAEEVSEEPFVIYSSADGGSSWEKEDISWARDIEVLSEDNVVIVGGDMSKDRSLAVLYQYVDEMGNAKEKHVLLVEAQQTADILLDTDMQAINVRIADDGNGVFVNCENSLVYYDKGGNLKQSYRQKGIIDFLERKKDMLVLSEEKLCVFDKETGNLEIEDTVFTEELSQELKETAERIRGIMFNASHVMKGGGEDACYFLLLTAGVYKHVPGDSEIECLVGGMRNVFSDNQMTIMDYVVRADDDIAVLSMGTSIASLICYTTKEEAPESAAVPEPVTTSVEEGTDGNLFANYQSSYVEKINIDLTGTVTVYCLQSSDVIQEMINVYQRTHPNVDVQLVTGMDEDSNITVDQAVASLNTELLSGTGPDVIIMDGLNVSEYQEKGLLLDLSDLYKDINQNFELMTNITECYKTEKGIYAIPAHVSPTLMLGKQDIVEKIDSMEDLAEYVEKNDSLIGNSLSMYTWKQLYDVLYPCVSNQILNDDKYDSAKTEEFIKEFKRIWDTLEKQLEGHGDRWQYEDLKEDFAEERGIDLDAYLLLNLNNLAMPEISGQSLGIGRIYENINFTLIFGIARKKPDYIYRPLSLGDRNVYIPVAVAAINAESRNMELARDFVREMFAPNEQEVAGSMVEGLPVNWEGLSLSCHYNASDWSSWVGGWLEEHGGNLYGMGARIESQEEYAYFKEYLNGLEIPANMNEIVSSFIQENMEAYLSDEISTAEYMERLEEKLLIYLSE